MKAILDHIGIAIRDLPAVLLRQLFRLACDYSGQVFSYQKMLGQLQDVGNATTVAHYLELLSGAGMVTGLPKFSGTRVRQRASSPKLVVLNTALMTAVSGKSEAEHHDIGAAELPRERPDALEEIVAAPRHAEKFRQLGHRDRQRCSRLEAQ